MSAEQIDRIVIHTETVVKGFFGDYRWLSNYHDCPVHFRGRDFLNSEAAYQSAKSDDDYIKDQYTRMGGKESKAYSKTHSIRRDWDSVKLGVMYEVLKDKFTRNDVLRIKLLETGSKYLEETNYWGDTYWGVHEGKGKNKLGETLMKIRNELKLKEEWI